MSCSTDILENRTFSLDTQNSGSASRWTVIYCISARSSRQKSVDNPQSIELDLPPQSLVPVLCMAEAQEESPVPLSVGDRNELRNDIPVLNPSSDHEMIESLALCQPYGTIYPYGTELSKTNGFAAYVLYRLYMRADVSQNDESVASYLSSFDWQKFMELCAQVEDVWALDVQAITQAIASGTFTKALLKCP